MAEQRATPGETEDLITAIESGTLQAGQFHHRDHVKLAWLYLRDLPLATVLERYPAAIKGFAARLGASDLYHETITWAYLLLINERMSLPDGRTSWESFAAQNDDLMSYAKSILKRYYREETLSSERAKSTFLLPDRLELA